MKTFYPNYIKCPDCKNVLDLSFSKKVCPNPLCGFNFKGVEKYLKKDSEELRKEYILLRTSGKRDFKLLETGIRFNIGEYLKHFIECTWSAHYETLFKLFIRFYLDDLDILQKVLKSDIIKEKNLKTSKGGYKIYPALYNRLMIIHYPPIRNFLRLEFPSLYKPYYQQQFKELTLKSKKVKRPKKLT